MIKEFALEPDVISNWKDFRYFIDGFAIEKGRVLSEYPRHWKKLVYSSLGSCGDREKKRIAEALNHLKPPVLVSRSDSWDDKLKWIQNTIIAHAQNPFHAIIALDSDSENEVVIPADDCSEKDENSKWYITPSIRIDRQAGIMADTAKWILGKSKQIKFIDRNFRFHPKFLNPLKAFLEVIKNAGNITLIEYHLSFVNDMTEDHFKNEITKRIQRFIPKYCRFDFYHYDKNELHNRYILTDIGALSFGVGLDEFQTGDNQPPMDEVSLLAENVRLKLWTKYSSIRPFFTLGSK